MQIKKFQNFVSKQPDYYAIEWKKNNKIKFIKIEKFNSRRLMLRLKKLNMLFIHFTKFSSVVRFGIIEIFC